MNTYEIGDYSGCTRGGGERGLFAAQPRYQANSHMEAVKMYLNEHGITAKIKRSGRDGRNQFVAQKIVIQGDRVYMDYSSGMCQCWYEFAPNN
jgi:hypothetical protein